MQVDVTDTTFLKGCAKKGGDLTWGWRGTGTFSQPFNLHEFPKDTQRLGISLQADRWVLSPGESVKGKRCVRFILEDTDDPVPSTIMWPGVTAVTNTVQLKALGICTGHTPRSESKKRSAYSKVDAYVVVKRRPGYFVWNVVIPSFVFTSLAFLSLLTPAEDLADRLSVNLTLMLTLAACVSM